MAENENGEEKTEKATSKKRKDARKKGQVLKSQDVAAVVSIFIVFFVLRLTGKLTWNVLSDTMERYLSMAGKGIGSIEQVGPKSVYTSVMLDLTKTSAAAAGIVLAASTIVAIFATGIQTKFLITFERIKFKLSKLNPINGIKSKFSVKAMFEIGKSLLKMVVLVAVVYGQVKKRLPEFMRLMYMEPVEAVPYIAKSVFSIVMLVAGTFVAIAAVDFLYQRYSFEKDLMMTKQEVKEEFKQMEGDPHIKGKRRSIQQKMAYARMMQNVSEADVVIRNPTHFAVAIKYDSEKNTAPVVVAKGQDMAALRIVDIAAEHNVPSVENVPLARALYEKVEIEREIPPEFYHSVAEVLAFVYDLKKKQPPLGNRQPQSGAARTPFNY
ncbi:MAG: flagellar biosynthesis protein FlhB [Huintestinicola sp.]